jgi:hypothetical protein
MPVDGIGDLVEVYGLGDVFYGGVTVRAPDGGACVVGIEPIALGGETDLVVLAVHSTAHAGS